MMCATVDSQCLEYLGYITLIAILHFVSSMNIKIKFDKKGFLSERELKPTQKNNVFPHGLLHTISSGGGNCTNLQLPILCLYTPCHSVDGRIQNLDIFEMLNIPARGGK